MLINILINAKDASARGGRVKLTAMLRGADVALTVQDRGAGIAAEVREKIFDPFFTTKDVDKGTGLGLAISHGIVERHQGRIEVACDEGGGTCFSVLLPALRLHP